MNDRPDALSRRQQDMPRDNNDERLKARFRALLKSSPPAVGVGVAEMTETSLDEMDFSKPVPLFENAELQQLWEEARQSDIPYQEISRAVLGGIRKLAASLQVNTSLAECDLDGRQLLRFRKRIWIPNCEPLRTKIIQQTHDSHITGHPGRDATYAILARRYFWPGAAKDVRQFLRNCATCGRNTIWREHKHGLLKPLPIPERIWAEISIDFITELPPTGKEGATNCMVITDRLTKGVILEDMADISAEAVAERFLKCFYAYHGLPLAITSDRGPQFVGDCWKRICELLEIEQRLSTGYHPQTDGATERANQEVEKVLRIFITYAQTDWGGLLPVATTAINNKDAASTGLSPFFFTHGYHVSPIPEVTAPEGRKGSPKEVGEAFISRLHEATDWAQAAIAIAQDRQQEYANKSKTPAPVYREGDLVWLNLKNVKTDRPCKKLDWLHAKYRVKKVVSSHSMELDVPQGIHPVFHVDLLRPTAGDPLPSQVIDDAQPPAMLIDGQEEYLVEEILCARWKTIQGGHKRRQVLVKWKGYAQPTWEPLGEYDQTEALDAFEKRYGNAWNNDGPREDHDIPKNTRRGGKRGNVTGQARGTTEAQPQRDSGTVRRVREPRRTEKAAPTSEVRPVHIWRTTLRALAARIPLSFFSSSAS